MDGVNWGGKVVHGKRLRWPARRKVTEMSREMNNFRVKSKENDFFFNLHSVVIAITAIV